MKTSDLPTYIGAAISLVVVGFVILQFATVIRLSSDTLHSHGSIVTSPELGIYQYGNYTKEVTEIDWGTLYPGSTANETFYLHNEGYSPLMLSMYVANWQPPMAATYMNCTWDYDGSLLESGGKRPVTFSLSVSPDVENITTFSFDIHIDSEV